MSFLSLQKLSENHVRPFIFWGYRSLKLYLQLRTESVDNFEDNIRVKKSWRGFSKKVLSPYQNRQWQTSKSGVLTRCKSKYQQTKCNVDWTQV